jgi:hypothetical protein
MPTGCRSRLLLFAISLVLVGCGTSRAANHLEAIKQGGLIKVGTSADYPPLKISHSSTNTGLRAFPYL